MAEIFELPEDILLNLPRMTFVGQKRLSIENHRGVIEYTREKIRVGMRGGEIIIYGRELQMIRFMADEIHVGGSIEKVHFEE